MNRNDIDILKIEITIRNPASANLDPTKLAHGLFGTGLVRRKGASAWAARVSGWTKAGRQFDDKTTGV